MEVVRSRFVENRESRAAAGLLVLSGSIFNVFWRGGSEFVGVKKFGLIGSHNLLDGVIKPSGRNRGGSAMELV